MTNIGAKRSHGKVFDLFLFLMLERDWLACLPAIMILSKTRQRVI